MVNRIQTNRAGRDNDNAVINDVTKDMTPKYIYSAHVTTWYHLTPQLAVNSRLTFIQDKYFDTTVYIQQ